MHSCGRGDYNVHYPNKTVRFTISTGMRLNTVDNVRVSHEHVDHPTTPFVPYEHTTTITTTEDPVLTPKVSLLDLKEGKGEREKGRGRGEGEGRERERE